ncbi:hypothetical protein [Nocardioides sp. T2.26MG-1]|uniref:hypothetical protein n=1 Tax=Nocardioides sp. T2.26MG-1 TaxID=3041166 RepID=UPI0025412C7A|nr:hypothetical protein [Nocardioides sp. T2.26MG-1]
MPIARRRLVLCAATLLACAPYLVLKIAWLAGSSVGMASGAAGAEMHDHRYVVGNLVTVAMDLAAVALVLALTFPWGRRVPGWLLAGPVWVAAGLLAPIAVGLPVGLVLQALVGGAPAPGDNGLAGWVYAVVYGGFVLQGVGILGAFWWHASERWPAWWRAGRLPARPATIAATVAAVGFGGLHLAWAVAGSAAAAPGGFETAAQRAYLGATGVLILAGVVLDRAAIAWVGTAVTVFAGPTKILLAHDGRPGAVVLATGLLGTVAGLWLVCSLVRSSVRSPRAVLP